MGPTDRTGTTASELLEATVNVKDPACWVSILAANFPVEIRILSSQVVEGGWMKELVDITTGKGSLDPVLASLQESPKVRLLQTRWLDFGHVRAIVDTKACSACRARIRSNCLVSHAYSEGSGGVRWSVAAPGTSALGNLIDSLRASGCEIMITRLNGSPKTRGLTQYQREVIRVATNLGFFDARRQIGLKDLAQRFHVSKEAVRRTLLRAEKRLAKDL